MSRFAWWKHRKSKPKLKSNFTGMEIRVFDINGVSLDEPISVSYSIDMNPIYEFGGWSQGRKSITGELTPVRGSCLSGDDWFEGSIYYNQVVNIRLRAKSNQTDKVKEQWIRNVRATGYRPKTKKINFIAHRITDWEDIK